jgi:hypothetical protein
MHRRRWDVLRITFETTVRSSPPEQPVDSLPPPVAELLMETPHSLVSMMYSRSLRFFTPQASGEKKPTVADALYLPPQVLITTVYSSLKLECPDVGRTAIEEWLARRQARFPGSETVGEGYEKVVELYCLNILPALKQWDYASEFLEYEIELKADAREVRFLFSCH